MAKVPSFKLEMSIKQLSQFYIVKQNQFNRSLTLTTRYFLFNIDISFHIEYGSIR